MTIRPLGSKLFLADGRANGQTDGHDKSNSRSLQFSEDAYNRMAPPFNKYLNRLRN